MTRKSTRLILTLALAVLPLAPLFGRWRAAARPAVRR